MSDHYNGTADSTERLKFEYTTAPEGFICKICGDAINYENKLDHKPICSDCITAITDAAEEVREVVLVKRGRVR